MSQWLGMRVTLVPLFLCLVYRVLLCCVPSESFPFPSPGLEESDRHRTMSLMPWALSGRVVMLDTQRSLWKEGREGRYQDLVTL